MTRRVLFVALLLVSCAHGAWVSDRLFFGRSIPGGGAVSDEEWNSFVAEVVTPRFPQGMTIIDARGQWREADGRIVGEPVAILELLHPPGPDADAKIEEIMRLYRERFRQEAVMRVRTRAGVLFDQGV